MKTGSCREETSSRRRCGGPRTVPKLPLPAGLREAEGMSIKSRPRRLEPYIDCMRQPRQLDDTSADARAKLRALYLSMTPAEKLERMSELTRAANQLSLAGLAARYPEESRPELLLRLARLRLGDEQVELAYGPRNGA